MGRYTVKVLSSNAHKVNSKNDRNDSLIQPMLLLNMLVKK